MAERDRYRVYVDETGDRGWGGSSSPIFVVSAVIVRDADTDTVRSMLDGINAKLGKPPGTVLHWSENVKAHSQRKFVAGEFASAPITIANVAVLKHSMMGSGSGLSDPAQQYNYAVRRLLERVSWDVDDNGGEARITFAHVRRFPYERLRAYLRLLQAMGTEIRWNAIDRVRINQPHRVRLLQAADLAAGCCHSAFREDDFGDFEPGYLMTLIPRIYRNPPARVSSYGMNIIGAKGCMNDYPWWEEFVTRCAEHDRQ